MKIRILSDLHLEFASFTLPETKCDVVVFAGDVDLGAKGLDWILDNIKDKPVIYVLGNHEYYKKSYPKLLYQLQDQAAHTHVHILENQTLEINGIYFFGCTLWTDFELFGDPEVAGYYATQQMTDYKKIKKYPEYSKLRSRDTAVVHYKSRRWLQEALATYKNVPKVVITHHSPTSLSLPSDYEKDILSAAYASDLNNLIEASDVRLWIHGHIHKSSDFYVGKTRVICNPRGYPDEHDNGFNPELVIEIDNN